MITPPLSISAIPRLTCAVPVCGVVTWSDTLNLLSGASGGYALNGRPVRATSTIRATGGRYLETQRIVQLILRRSGAQPATEAATSSPDR
jgi:hypothetical protein